MSEANKRVLEQANAAITQGDFDGFLRHCTEDTEWTFVGDRTLRGKAEVRRWMEETYKEPPRFRVERLVADGDSLVAIGEITLVEEGRPADHRYCDVRRLRDGKLAELQAFVV